MKETLLDRAKKGVDLKTGKRDTRSFEYTSVTTCPHNTPGGIGADDICMGAMQACARNTPEEGQGPMVRLYRREVDAKGAAKAGWELLGTSCLGDPMTDKQEPDTKKILAAFHDTKFALPMVHIQPEANLTLVTLPTYFEVKWPTAGFQPGEIDTPALLDHRVEIRPVVRGYNYFFGDETGFGPTLSPGGIYPTGITHVYLKRGVYPTQIQVIYGGEYRVDGRAWRPLPGTVPVSGPTQLLTVKSSHARLVTPDRRPWRVPRPYAVQPLTARVSAGQPW
jgi:hypothetical protein